MGAKPSALWAPGSLRYGGSGGSGGAAANDSRSDASDEGAAMIAEKPTVGAPELHGTQWLSALQQRFGCKLLVLIFVTQHLLKGFAGKITWQMTPYLYKLYHVPAQRVQMFGAITGLPWVVKPITGLLSDLCPIAGYNKGPYMLAASTVGLAACLAVSLLPQETIPVPCLVLCLFLVQVKIATNDLLTEALIAEKMQSDVKHGNDLLSYVFAGVQAGSLVAVVASGILLDSVGPRLSYGFLAVPACLAAASVALGHVGEHQRSREETEDKRREFGQQEEVRVLVGILFVASVAISACATMISDARVNFAFAFVAIGVVSVSFSTLLTPVIAKFCVFSLLQTSMSVSVGGASFYFMTDSPKEYPEGPHFSDLFFNTIVGCVGGLFSILGVLTYRRLAVGKTYRSILVVTNLVLCGLHLSDVILFRRANLWFGIPDQAFLLGGSALVHVVDQWHWMPQMALYSYLCPKGMEATMFGLAVGCHNLGYSLSRSGGALLLNVLGCNPRGVPGDAVEFENLWIASGVASLLPLVTVLLASKLVPDARQGEPVGADVELEVTAGSLWRRWMSR